MYRCALSNLVPTLNMQTCLVQVGRLWSGTCAECVTSAGVLRGGKRTIRLNIMANKTGKPSFSSYAQETAGKIKRVSIEGNIGK